MTTTPLLPRETLQAILNEVDDADVRGWVYIDTKATPPHTFTRKEIEADTRTALEAGARKKIEGNASKEGEAGVIPADAAAVITVGRYLAYKLITAWQEQNPSGEFQRHGLQPSVLSYQKNFDTITSKIQAKPLEKWLATQFQNEFGVGHGTRMAEDLKRLFDTEQERSAIREALHWTRLRSRLAEAQALSQVEQVQARRAQKSAAESAFER